MVRSGGNTVELPVSQTYRTEAMSWGPTSELDCHIWIHFPVNYGNDVFIKQPVQNLLAEKSTVKPPISRHPNGRLKCSVYMWWGPLLSVCFR